MRRFTLLTAVVALAVAAAPASALAAPSSSSNSVSVDSAFVKSTAGSAAALPANTASLVHNHDGTVTALDRRGRVVGYVSGTTGRSWWQTAKCVGAITWVIGSSIFAVAKITKIRGAIRALGGVRETARLLVGATRWSEKMSVLGSAGAGAASYFLGIDTIRNNC